MKITKETLKQILDAFNQHDLNAIMKFFSEECSLDFPKGPEPWGQRFIGKVKVQEALASRFKGIPDVTMEKTVIGFLQMEIWEYQNGHLPEQQLQGFVSK